MRCRARAFDAVQRPQALQHNTMHSTSNPSGSAVESSDAFTWTDTHGGSSLSSGWKRWRRYLRCTLAAHLPDRVISRFAYNPQQTQRSNWDAEHTGGHWEYLRNTSEIARYGIISSYCHSYSSGGGLLDHGCGQGILRDHLNPNSFNGYVGIDLSADAINKASHPQISVPSCFTVGDVETYSPDQVFDVIVFNEMLYYLSDPAAVVQRYQPFLSPGGVFVVSMFDMIKSRKVWQSLERNHRLMESSRAVNQGGHSWTVRVYRP